MERSDQELLRSSGRGDRQAFEVLVARWSPKVMDLACRFLRDEERAQDIHQQTFLRVWAGAASFEGRARFSTWLHQVVVNLCRDSHRASVLEPRTREILARRSATRGAAGPDVTVAGRERAERVAEAVSALPDEEREVVMLKHYAGLTFSRVAEVLGVPPSTVKSRMGRALDRLRFKLEDMKP